MKSIILYLFFILSVSTAHMNLERQNLWSKQVTVLKDQTLHVSDLYKELIQKMSQILNDEILINYNGKFQFQQRTQLISQLESAHTMLNENLLPFLKNLKNLDNRVVIQEESILLRAYKAYSSDNLIEAEKAYNNVVKEKNACPMHTKDHLSIMELFTYWTLANRELLRTAQTYDIILRNDSEETQASYQTDQAWHSYPTTWTNGIALLSTSITCLLLYKQYKQQALLIQAFNILSSMTPEVDRSRILNNILSKLTT